MSLVSFYDNVTHSTDEEEVADVMYLDFTKAFNMVPTSSSWTNWLAVVQTSVLFGG